MNMKHFDKMDKINYYISLLLVFGSIIYAAVIAEPIVEYDDYTFAPIMVGILVILISYVFFTIVKSNRLIEFVLGIVAIILLESIVPIIGYEYDPMATTAQYYKIMSGSVLIGIAYITAFKIIKYAAKKDNAK